MKNSELINLLSRYPWNAEVSVELTTADAAEVVFTAKEDCHGEIQRITPIGCNLHDIQIEIGKLQ